MKTYQFKGVRVYTESITVELECESLEEAQSIIDGGEFEHGIVSCLGHEDIDLEYVGIENCISMDDPRFLFDTEDMIDAMFSKE